MFSLDYSHIYYEIIAAHKLYSAVNVYLMYKLIEMHGCTVVSLKAKKQHVRTSSSLCDHYSELFTHGKALKFVNTVTKLL